MNHLKHVLILICLGIFFFVLGNNFVSLTNPDEVFYALSAKEMAQHHTWLVPYIFNQPQFEKPIFFFWLLKIGFQMFGSGSFAARFFPSLFAIVGCIGTYLFCKLSFKDENKAFFCAVILLSSVLYVAMARVVMTDMVFSIFVVLSLFSFYAGYVVPSQKTCGVIFLFILMALAVLTKGLLGCVFPLTVIFLFLIMRRDLRFIFSKAVLIGSVLFLALALPWYVYMLKHYGPGFISEFFYNDHIRRILEAEHAKNDKWYFYPVVIILGMLPWSIAVVFAAVSLIKRLRENEKNPVYIFLVSWIVCIFVVCQVAHSKLASYILPLFPAVAIITADYLWELIKKNKRMFLFMVGLSILPFICISTGLLLLSTGKSAVPLEYRDYIPGKIMAISYFCFSSILLLVAVIFALKERQKQSVYVLAMHIPLVLILMFLLRKDYEPYVSSQDVSEFLLKQPDEVNIVLCSKMFARGVRYYTNKDIAVIGGSYFSPHPIPMLDTKTSILEFLLNKKVVYAIVKKSDLRRIKEAVKTQFNIEEIKQIGDAYLVKIG